MKRTKKQEEREAGVLLNSVKINGTTSSKSKRKVESSCIGLLYKFYIPTKIQISYPLVMFSSTLLNGRGMDICLKINKKYCIHVKLIVQLSFLVCLKLNHVSKDKSDIPC